MKIFRYADRAALITFLVGGAFYALDIFLRAALFITVSSVIVPNVVEGETAQALISKSVRMEFDGSYREELRTYPTKNLVCTGGYDKRFVKLGEVLETRPVCESGLMPGSYILEACYWVKSPLKILSDRETCQLSNVFTVTSPNQDYSKEEVFQLEQQVISIEETLKRVQDQIEGVTK